MGFVRLAPKNLCMFGWLSPVSLHWFAAFWKRDSQSVMSKGGGLVHCELYVHTVGSAMLTLFFFTSDDNHYALLTVNLITPTR